MIIVNVLIYCKNGNETLNIQSDPFFSQLIEILKSTLKFIITCIKFKYEHLICTEF